MAKQVAVVSDTHGFLSKDLLKHLQHADLIVHAGDICSSEDIKTRENIALLKLCLGNNDYGFSFAPQVKKNLHFIYGGLLWQVCHYRERLMPQLGGIEICGHTHKPFIDQSKKRLLVMNPGSPTFPRAEDGPTMGWIVVDSGEVQDAKIIHLDPASIGFSW